MILTKSKIIYNKQIYWIWSLFTNRIWSFTKPKLLLVNLHQSMLLLPSNGTSLDIMKHLSLTSYMSGISFRLIKFFYTKLLTNTLIIYKSNIVRDSSSIFEWDLTFRRESEPEENKHNKCRLRCKYYTLGRASVKAVFSLFCLGLTLSWWSWIEVNMETLS